MKRYGMYLAMALLMAAGNAALAEGGGQPAADDPASESKLGATGKKAGEIVTQPVRDVGIDKASIPPVLEQASEDPYSLKGLKGCTQLSAAMTELNEVLGPDFEANGEKKENRAGKLAEAGGKTVVNAFIPFRGLVREISGAAPAQRRLDAAVTIGIARRGFLRGVYNAKSCRPAI